MLFRSALNLHGPTVGVQTACSTSLVAVHLACEGVLSGQCDIALAGGVTVRVPQTCGYYYIEGGILSPDGACRAFDVSAGGTVFGSGLGVVALRRYTDALADGDQIHAIIVGSAVNNDGSRKVGFTAPSVEGQAAVIAEALEMSRLRPDAIGFIEAHGTGTRLGDAIEATALQSVFRDVPRRAYLGSVKSNVGHLEAAAGVAGLVKAILALEHEEIPPSINCSTPIPELGEGASRFRVNDVVAAWPRSAEPRHAGVSSFGIGGANAHVVLREAPAVQQRPSRRRSWHILHLSAKTLASLERTAAEFADRLDGLTSHDVADVCHSAHAGRVSTFDQHIVVQGADADELRKSLRSGVLRSWRARAPGRRREPPAVAFLFPDARGGSKGEARQLYQESQIFREAFHEIDAAAREVAGVSPVAVFTGEAHSASSDTVAGETTHLAIQIALLRFWESVGVRPAAVFGLGTGELAAACAAGALDPAHAFRILFHRDDGMRDGAFGIDQAARVDAAPTIVSGRTGAAITLAELAQPLYHARGPSDPAHVEAGLRRLDELGFALHIEVGAAGSFGAPVRAGLTIVPSVSSDSRDWHVFFDAIAQLQERGVRIDWAGVTRGDARRVTVPSYQFDEREHWLKRRAGRRDTQESRGDAPEAREHPLLQVAVNSATGDSIVQGRVDAERVRYLRDHVFFGRPLLPFSVLIEFATAAARAAGSRGTVSLRDVFVKRPVWLPDGEQIVLQAIVATRDGRRRVDCYVSRPGAGDESWTDVLEAQVVSGPETDGAATFPRSSADGEVVAPGAFYSAVEQHGAAYGPAFRTMTALRAGAGEAYARLELGAETTADHRYDVHPALLDGALQTLVATRGISAGSDAVDGDTTFLPVAIDAIDVFDRRSKAPGRVADARAQAAAATSGELIRGDVTLYDDDGEVRVRMRGVSLRSTRSGELLATQSAHVVVPELFGVRWQPSKPDPVNGTTRVGAPSLWIIHPADGIHAHVAHELAERLDADGHTAIVVAGDEDVDDAIARRAPLFHGSERSVKIVEFRAMDADATRPDGDGLARGHAAYRAVFETVQRCVRESQQGSVELWLVTEGAYAIADGDDVRPLQAGVWGLGRTLALERPDVYGGSIDLDPRQGAESRAALLLERLASAHAEPESALRHGEWYVPRLTRLGPRQVADREFAAAADFAAADGTYVVVGGTGALGLRTAAWLADRGAKHVAIVGRTMNPGAERVVAELQSAGVTVTTLLCDVSNAAAAAATFARLNDVQPEVAGVVFAPGIVDDGILSGQSWDRIAKVLAPKVDGGWHLWRWLETQQLSSCVLFSSVVGVTGAPGQGSYAMANAFVDALAFALRRNGTPALSIGWGPWAGGGLATRAAARSAGKGVEWLTPLEPGAAFDGLRRATASGSPHVICANVAWEEASRESLGSRIAILRDVVAAGTPHDSRERQAAFELLLERVRAAGEKAHNLIVGLLRTELVALLKLAESDAPLASDRLFDIGIDSLAALELRNRLERVLGLSLPATVILNYPTLDAIAGYVLAQVDAALPPERVAAPPDEDDARTAHLTREEIERELLFEIERVEAGDAR